MRLYKYGMRLRGFSPGCQPTSGFITREAPLEKKYYDVLVYDRALSEDELVNYELDYLGLIDTDWSIEG